MAETRPVKLPFITEVLRGRINKAHRRGSFEPSSQSSRNCSVTMDLESPLSETTDGFSPIVEGVEYDGASRARILKVGDLIKTSKSRRNNQIHGPPRKRRFRVSEEAIEYLQLFSQVKVKKSFPITSILEIKIVETNPTSFQVVFQNFIMELEACSSLEANDWVATIQKCVSDWQEDELCMSLKRPVITDDTNNNTVSSLHKDNTSEQHSLREDPSASGMDPLDEGIVMRDKIVRPFSPGRTRSKTVGEMLKTWSTEDHAFVGTYGQRRGKRMTVKRKLYLAPKLEKQAPVVINRHDEEEEQHWKILHNDFAMIKYPRHLWGRIPSEKIFQLDKDNLQIMWKNTSGSKIKISSTLKLDSILEVRLGQQTDGFEKFPYEEVANQSFSLVYEDFSGKYAKLGSLDLICDHPLHFEKWVLGLRSLNIGPVTAMFPSRYANTDPILIWLKRFWACSSINHELGQRDAISIVKKIHSTISNEHLKIFLNSAHNHQHEASIGTGVSLRWDGFVLLYSLLVGETGQLHSIYRNYAKTYKRLGMTIEEFKEFLMNECHFTEEACQRRKLKEMVSFHDHHHLAFKKYTGNNKPSNWKTSCKLLSYAGFLSFLRSKHNATVNPAHDAIYHDMGQPLSHYFINSSHNTYLETDQIKGRSTLDAYVRTLLQGCRCVEIDCWDNTIGKEPIIYHGFTFTSKLPLRDVIKTINKYAFHMSHYPVIISIENHCNEQQQARMARIFQEEFKNELGQCIVATEDLVQGHDLCRRRLPSPTELQGKILLKGSYKIQTPKSRKAMSKHTSSGIIVSPRESLPNTPLKKSNGHNTTDPLQEELSPIEKSKWEWPSNENDQPVNKEDDIPVNKGSILLTRGKTRREAKRFSARVKEAHGDNIETPEDDQELAYIETSRDLRNMIVYCRSTSIKPWSWKEQKQTSICQMFSFGEISATNHCKRSPKEMLACSERQFVRTYPKGARIDSSNYNPVLFWNHGIQMAAINFQTPDLYMHLNQGRFRQNGGCGYVLKPEIMRQENPSSGKYPFDPLMKKPHPLIPTCQLDIELLTGQNLQLLDKSCISISVQISTHGVYADTHLLEPAESTDIFCPTWPSGYRKYSHLIIMPELCLVYFRVDVSVRHRTLSQLFGQNCIPLNSLRPGIKYIPLRKAGGELIPESGLFVKIEMQWNEPTPPKTPPTPCDTPPTPCDTPPTPCDTPPTPCDTPPTPCDTPSHVPCQSLSSNDHDTRIRRSQLIHQDEIDITKSLSIGIMADKQNGNNESSLVNYTSDNDNHNDNNEVVVHVEKGENTETQTVTLEVVAEISDQ